MINHPRCPLALASACAIALLFALGCSKESDTAPPASTSSAPQVSTQNVSPPPVETEARPEAATPNSFYPVMKRLDQGGSVYAYLGTEQWLAGVGDKLNGLKDTLLKNIPSEPEERAQIEKGVSAAVSLIRNCGLEEISGVGFSGFALQEDLHRTKFIIHHYPDQGDGFVWSMFGKAPGKLEGLKLLPANTVVASSTQFDLPGLWATVEAEVKAAGYPEADQQLAQAKGMFAMMSGMEFDKFMAALGGEYGVAITMDKTQPVQIPGATPTTIPRPDILIFAKANYSLIYDRLLTLAKAQEMPILENNEDGLKSASMPVPLPIGAEYKATLAYTEGLLLFATSPALVREALAVRSGDKPGLTATPEFQRLARSIPTEANSFNYVSETFGEVYLDFQMKSVEQTAATSGVPETAWLREVMETFAKPAAAYGVFQNTSEGWLWTGNSSTPAATRMAAGMVVAPAGLLAAVAIPNFVKARATAQRNSCIANLKQIDGAKQQWAIDNRKPGTDTPTAAELYGLRNYLKREPTCPTGGIYSINEVRRDPTCSHGDSHGHTLPPPATTRR